MIPDQLRLVPVYLMLIDFPVTSWNLIGTYQGFVLINLVTATNLFLMRQYFLTIPKDYEEAAKLDGAGYFKTYWKVMLPLASACARGGHDPAVPGHVERVLLGADHPAGRVEVHAADRHLDLHRRVQHAVAGADGGERDRDPAGGARLRALPALLHRRRGRGGGEGMTSASTALWAALADLYHQSWRLVLLNAALSAVARAAAPRRGVGAAPARARGRRRRAAADGAHALRRDARADGGPEPALCGRRSAAALAARGGSRAHRSARRRAGDRRARDLRSRRCLGAGRGRPVPPGCVRGSIS